MATDDFLWSLVLHEAASGSVDFEYLNEEKHVCVTDEQSSVRRIVPSLDCIESECLFNELFSFDDDVVAVHKTSQDATISVGDFSQDITELAQSIVFTESCSFENETPDLPIGSLPDIDLKCNDIAVAISSDHQYIAEPSKFMTPQPVLTIAPLPVLEDVAFQGLTAELLNDLLATFSSMSETAFDGSISNGESSMINSEESANCSEDEYFEGEMDDAESNVDSNGMTPSFRNGPQKARHRNKDRKIRKMQQNRVAAYRYRQKKKAENSAIQMEREKLEKNNSSLKMRIQQMTQEIGYLRSLMTDMVNLRASKQ